MRPFAQRWTRRVALNPVLAMLLVTILVVRAPELAWGHGVLKSSSPASGAHLGAVPRELRLTFTEAPELAVTTVALQMSDSATVALGPLRLAGDRRTVVAAVRGPLRSGTYTVVWKMAVADMVNAYSPTALAFAGLAAVTGVFAAWLHLGDLTALWQTAYGQTLLLKLGVLSLLAGTGAYNWLRVKPTLGDIEGARRVRRSAAVEIAIAVVVLLITAVLVATPPPSAVEGDTAGMDGGATSPEAGASSH